MGHGASLLWAGAPRDGMKAAFYDRRHPGYPQHPHKIRPDHQCSARRIRARSATIYAKFAGTSKWEPAPMMPQQSGVGFEFLFRRPTRAQWIITLNRTASNRRRIPSLPSMLQASRSFA